VINANASTPPATIDIDSVTNVRMGNAIIIKVLYPRLRLYKIISYGEVLAR
jgi:hypothetical protein